MQTGLNYCLTQEANVDQAARMFRQDLVMTLFERGVVAIVPTDTTDDPNITGGYDVNTMRVGWITQWFPRHVRVSVYDDRPDKGGVRRELIFPKSMVAIIENPLYAVMNEPNSTLQRIIRKLNLLDAVDEQSGSGKLDLIIQLPYVIKSDARRNAAEQRRQDIETQLKGSKYGIAYTDGTEKITQLNRAAENNLMDQVTTLMQMLYSELGMPSSVFDGTADDAAMLNYHNRTIDPILGAITEAIKRSFLTKTARTQNQSVEYYRDPFKFVAAKDLAELADKLIRNMVVTKNEFRGFLGMPPSSDPSADKLENPNVPTPTTPAVEAAPKPSPITLTATRPTPKPTQLPQAIQRLAITKQKEGDLQNGS